MAEKSVKTGVQRGRGEPEYQWTVSILHVAFEEAMAFLTPAGYQHLAMQVKELARQGDPTHSVTVSVRAIEDFYEIRDKGGPLGKHNVRVFFGCDARLRRIVILGTLSKKNDGATPLGDRKRMARRWRAYSRGDYVME